MWVALVGGVGTELNGRLVGAAWVAAWVMEPVVLLRQVALRVEDLREQQSIRLKAKALIHCPLLITL